MVYYLISLISYNLNLNLFTLQVIYTWTSLKIKGSSQLRFIVSAQLPVIGNAQLVEPSLIGCQDTHYDGSANRILISASHLLGKHSILT